MAETNNEKENTMIEKLDKSMVDDVADETTRLQLYSIIDKINEIINALNAR